MDTDQPGKPAAPPPAPPKTTRQQAAVSNRALKAIEQRHDALQSRPEGQLDAPTARNAALDDVAAISKITDKALQSRAGAVIAETAELQPAYKFALREASPATARTAEQAYGAERLRNAVKEDRKAFEYGDRRDDAAQDLATRYSSMAAAGLSAKDLQGPALERLAVADSKALLLLDGYPPHPRRADATALVAESLKSDAYRTGFDRETQAWLAPQAGRQPRLAENVDVVEKGALPKAPAAQRQIGPASPPGTSRPVPVDPDLNSMRLTDAIASRRLAVPPLEDRFNVLRIGLVDTVYRFRDQAGKVAFTDKLLSITTATESPAAIKAMVDRAAERGWSAVTLKGSPEFVRQGWIAATAQGIEASGHQPSSGDRDAAGKERIRLGLVTQQPFRETDTIDRGRATSERGPQDRSAPASGNARQLAAAIEKALGDGKVSPEIRDQVRTMWAAEGVRRVERGARFKVPVYDASATRLRSNSVVAGQKRLDDRERSR